jgi:hypothetical protein
MIKLNAYFIGQDERLDYKSRYQLEIQQSIVAIKKEAKIVVICPYESLESFFKNWNISVG